MGPSVVEMSSKTMLDEEIDLCLVECVRLRVVLVTRSKLGAFLASNHNRISTTSCLTAGTPRKVSYSWHVRRAQEQ